MNLKLKPIEDRLVIEVCDPEKVTPGGIVLPERAQEKSRRGLVIAAGPGRRSDAIGGPEFIAMQIKVGDEVLFNEYAGIDVEDGIKVIREPDVIAVVEK